MAYDIYSLGLVFAEIGWWMSTKNLFLQAISRKSPRANEPMVEVARFGEEEAERLRRMVLSKLRKELAFKMGSPYRDVVE
jgi:hypothetical protein